ncbi:GST_C domain-containing protein/GST_N_3 domain-containing protein [Cephalotus follicularis]|uniref:glutathione transferase n=1 Tax=Cephalotus follicularis TaxID=3775 RepID=A0A1Q3CDW4_CEPFO|nr:GST_C domain-containing protein/GST_N_3 domain-containing protein [Cephalotus follicularis]
MGDEVKLFGMWASAFSRRVELALKLKGIQYEYIEEDLSNKSDLLLKNNPVHKKVPVLVHNGNSIAESLVILEYIDETWKVNPILPQDPYARAMARFWGRFIDEKVIGTLHRAIIFEGKEQEENIKEVHKELKLLENEVKGKDFFGGDTIGYVDIVAQVVAFWVELLQEIGGLELLTKDKFSFLYEWIGKLQNIEAVNECRPPREKHLEYIRALVENAKSGSK